MARFCQDCGTQLNFDDEKCPSCGASTGITVSRDNSEPSETHVKGDVENNPYGQNRGYNGGYNRYQGAPYQQNGQGYNRFGQGGYNNGQGYNGPYINQMPYINPMMQKQRTVNVGLIIFSIINILFGCCQVIPMVMGIIALVMTIQAPKCVTDQDEESKKRTALILNVIAVVVLVFSMIASFMLGMLEALLYI